ncbi:DUF2190 family protein [Enterobacter sp. Ap-916]|uniref:DUF2190 family protein n=1 Tax=unclassified Enterobacter TaxID=2608935 RepID=UPI00141FD43B|nr:MULTISPECIES: capsid cement protein [unclassified Enterobacter]NIF58963.1 DUF2190 family protein [Enterobacter sp. Ap-867]NIG29621.1 DUF2190 family protein [Enterobacter sp. Ap-916]
MAKNFVQNGNTIPVNNTGNSEILSGDPVVIGSLVAVAITDIPAGGTGDGFASGVFLLPKLATDDIAAGTAVFIKAGKIQLDKADAVAAGVAWEEAGAGVTVVEVKING